MKRLPESKLFASESIKELGAEEIAVLVIDLDETLIRTDLLIEGIFHYSIQELKNPFQIIKNLFRGKAELKAFLWNKTDLDVETLPYSIEVISFITTAKAQGSKVVLASSSNENLVREIADHLELFDAFFGSTDEVNLSGKAKADLLDKNFGAGNYAYVGNSSADVPVWERSSAAIVVSNSRRIANAAKKVNHKVSVIESEKQSKSAWSKQLRVHQWVKNLLLIVPALTAFQIFNPEFWGPLVMGFVAFSLAASSVYIFNDAADLQNDRQHPTKKFRPMAAGFISLHVGVLVGSLLFVAGLGLGLFVGFQFFLVLLVYLITTLFYSFWLKKLMIVDCLVLAGLYTIRIVAGAVAVGIQLSFWLLAFSVFLFLSLALVKRYAELEVASGMGREKAAGRGYSVSDLPVILAFGSSSGFISVLIFALYLDSEAIRELYALPEFASFAIPILLYIIGRMWLLAHRGEMNEDPILFVMKDKVSVLSGLFMVGFLLIAHIGVGSWN